MGRCEGQCIPPRAGAVERILGQSPRRKLFFADDNPKGQGLRLKHLKRTQRLTLLMGNWIFREIGSGRGADVTKAADERGLAMVFTGIRHFRH